MSTSNQLQIDSRHCRAICDEIGERLRSVLRPETVGLPIRLQILIDRLADQDRELAPSIVPDLDDMNLGAHSHLIARLDLAHFLFHDAVRSS